MQLGGQPAWLQRLEPAETIIDEASTDAEIPNQPIEELLKSVLALFACLKDVYRNGKKQNPHTAGSHVAADSYARFLLWSELFDVGSVDQVLDTAHTLRRSCSTVTIALGRSIINVLKSLSESKQTAFRSLDELAHNFENWRERVQYIVSARQLDDGYASSADDDSSDDEGQHELATDITRLQDHVANLLALSPLLERSVLCFEKTRNFTEEHAKSIDYQDFREDIRQYALNILDRYPKADHLTVEVLAEANRQRYERLRQAFVEENTAEPPMPLSDYARTILAPKSIFHDSGLGSSIPVEPTLYAESYTSTQSQKLGNSRRVPPMPKAAHAGKPFECPICHKQISGITDRARWKQHVYSDLQPYVCLHVDCRMSPRIFGARDHWMQHRLAHTGFHSQEISMATAYGTTGLSSEYLPQEDTATTHPDPEGSEQSVYCCVLCKVAIQGHMKTVASHLAHHMQSISLLSLPTNLFEVESAETDNEEDLPESLRPRLGDIPKATLDKFLASARKLGSTKSILEGLRMEGHHFPSKERIHAADVHLALLTDLGREWQDLAMASRLHDRLDTTIPTDVVNLDSSATDACTQELYELEAKLDLEHILRQKVEKINDDLIMPIPAKASIWEPAATNVSDRAHRSPPTSETPKEHRCSCMKTFTRRDMLDRHLLANLV